MRTPLLQQMTSKNLENVHTIRNSRRDTFQCGAKTTLVFLHPKRPFWLPLPGSTSLVSGSTLQTEKWIKDTSQFNEDFIKNYNDKSDKRCFFEADV